MGESEASPCRRRLSGCFCVCCWEVTLWQNNVLFIIIILLLLLSRPCPKRLAPVLQSPWTVKTHSSCSILQAAQASPRALCTHKLATSSTPPSHSRQDNLIPFLYPSPLPFSSPLHPFSFTSLSTISTHLPPFFLTVLHYLSLPSFSFPFYHLLFSVSSSNLSLHSASSSDFSLPLSLTALPLSIHFLPLSDSPLLYPCSPLLCGARAHDVLHDVAGGAVLCSMPLTTILPQMYLPAWQTLVGSQATPMLSMDHSAMEEPLCSSRVTLLTQTQVPT